MKKFVAVLLPIILIGSLVMGFTVAASPCIPEDPEPGWDVVSRPNLPELARRAWDFGEGYQFTIWPWQCGRRHVDGSIVLRSTPAGNDQDTRQNYVTTIPARIGGVQQVVVTVGPAYLAWTNNDNPVNSWLRVRYVDPIGRVFEGYLHRRHLVPVN